VAEVLRRHQLDATIFYRWEREAKAGMLEALDEKPRGRGDDKDHEIERLKRELDRKRRIIAEVVEENLALKRGL
jgi:transposase-like protein